jgi:DNA-binding SARP family transcriptional activator
MGSHQLKLFGNFAFTPGDERLVDMSLAKNIGMLAVVALSKDCSCTRSKIMDLLWSDRSDQQARASLRHSLWSVKQKLNQFAGDLLLVDRRTVGINLAVCRIDVVEFLRLSRSGNRHDLEESISVYTGELLDGLVIHDPAWQEWLRQQGENLRLKYAENLNTLGEYYLSERDAESLIRTGRRLVELNNLCERGHCALMKGYYLRQQKSLALRQFEQYYDTIKRELNSFPDRNVQALYEEIKDDRMLSGAGSALKVR